MPYEILFQKITNEDEISYEWTSPEGRRFSVRDCSDESPVSDCFDVEGVDGKYFLEEWRPVRHGAYERDGKILQSKELATLAQKASPSEFYSSLPKGIEASSIVYMGGGYGVGSKFYGSLSDVKDAIHQHIQSDQWYSDHDPELASKVMEEHRRSGDEAKSSYNFWRSQLDALTRKDETAPKMFQGLESMFGSISKDCRDRLLAFRNEPSQETWDAVAHMVILGGCRTAWQIWGNQDSSAPFSLGQSGKWPSIPNPEDFFRYIEAERQEMVDEAKQKMDEAKEKLEKILSARDTNSEAIGLVR